jgi:hypothetical protein
LCKSHFEYLFRGSPNVNDLEVYNRTYNGILDVRKEEARKSETLAKIVPPAEPLPGPVADDKEKEAANAPEARQEPALDAEAQAPDAELDASFAQGAPAVREEGRGEGHRGDDADAGAGQPRRGDKRGKQSPGGRAQA